MKRMNTVRIWLEDRQMRLLEEGYRELGDEAKRLEREFERLDIESLKDIDWEIAGSGH